MLDLKQPTFVLLAAGFAVAVAFAACGEDPSPAEDTFDPDTTVVETTQPDSVLDALDAMDTSDDDTVDQDAVDTTPVDTTPFDPWSAPPRVADLTVEDGPTPTACLPLINGDAEAGTINGWSQAGGNFFATKRTNSFDGNYPIPFEGAYQLAAGTTEEATLRQTVTLDDPSVAAASWAVLSAWTRSREGLDQGRIRIEALDAGDVTLEERTNGPFQDLDWTQHQSVIKLRAGVTKLNVELSGRRFDGTENDAYFDGVTLCLYDALPRALEKDLYAPPYLMDVRSSRVTVRFETRTAIVAEVLYGTDKDALTKRVTGPKATRHEIVLTDLTPGTRHYYQVQYADAAFPTFGFHSAPDPLAPDANDARVEFVMFADNQDGPNNFAKLARLMAQRDPDFIIQAGDCVQNGVIEEYRRDFFGPLYGLGNRAPMTIGAGNHETYSSAVITSNESRALFDSMVSQPGNEHCFGFRWGPMFLMVIDTERPHARFTDQYDCIEAALSSDLAQDATFRTAIFHRPALTQYWSPVAGLPPESAFFTAGMDAPDVREFLAPLFNVAGVQLVFNGHNHLYQYVPEYQGVAWVTSGGGGGGLEIGGEATRVNEWDAFIDTVIFGQYHFLHVAIERGVMAVRAVDIKGDIFHEFEVHAD
ncbi:MAG: hypothetical protein ACI9MR_001587 [Myxococcota bacterium]